MAITAAKYKLKSCNWSFSNDITLQTREFSNFCFFFLQGKFLCVPLGAKIPQYLCDDFLKTDFMLNLYVQGKISDEK
jgi:hypothetical protein